MAGRHHRNVRGEALERPLVPGRAQGAGRGWAEVGALVGLVMSYIWGWQGTFAGAGVAVVALYFGLGAWVHRRHGESLEVLGLGKRRLVRGLLQALVVVGPLAAAALVAGAAAGAWHFPAPAALARDLAVYAAWGTVQQYGLLCILYRRLVELLPGAWAPLAVSGLLFGLFHIPNPFLVPVTVALGSLSAWLYRRVPNVLALGLAHGVLGVVLTYALPLGVTWGMRVGPGMLGR